MKRITFALSVIAFGFALSALMLAPTPAVTTSVVSALDPAKITSGVGSNAIQTSVTPPLKYAHQAGTPVSAN